MLASYNLRLSDGTLLVVDHDGLETWLVDDKAMVQLAGSTHWRPLEAFLAGERAAARNATRQAPSAVSALPLIPPPPRTEEKPVSAQPPPSDPEPFFVGEPPAVRLQPESVDDPIGKEGTDAKWSADASRRLEEVLQPDAPPIRLKAVDDEVHGQPSVPPWQEPREQRSIERPPSLLVLADDVGSPHSGNSPPSSAADDGLPIIRLKPRDDEGEAIDPSGPAVYEEPQGQDPRDEKLFRTVAAIGGFLSLWLGRLERQLGRLSSIGPGGQTPSASRTFDVPEVPPSVSTPPRLQLLAEEPTDLRDGFTRDRATPGPAHPSEPFRPPPPISELPTLRLADIDEQEATNEVYEGHSAIHIAWRWTKRAVVIGGLVAGGILAALTSETWLPKAVGLSRMLFAEIDERARSRDQSERRQRALREATEQLPYLAPGTIQLLLSRGDLDLPDVFRLASDAADRGLSALAPGEVQELKALRQQMLDALPTDERQRVREYERARTRRPTLAFEDRDVLELLARGARALTPASRARLQVLEGEAIAGGLAPHPPVQPRPAAG